MRGERFYFASPIAHRAFFFLLVPTVNMSGVTPHVNFNYDSRGGESWSKKYLLNAYPDSYSGIVDELFTAASKLVTEHNIIPGQHSRSDLQTLRKQHSQSLISEFNDRLAIQGHPGFVERMSFGVLVYAATAAKSKGSTGPATKAATPIKEDKLENFEINCCPYRYAPQRVGHKFKASLIGDWRKDLDLQLEDIRLSKLQQILQEAGLTSDASQADLTYQAEHRRIIGIKSDSDLQLAVGWHWRHGKIWMELDIMTQDDWGQRSSRPLVSKTDL